MRIKIAVNGELTWDLGSVLLLRLVKHQVGADRR